MAGKIILLVEDNLHDEALTMRALRKHGIANEVIVARDGAEALDILFATGSHEGRPLAEMPEVVLLDLNLPKIGGFEVLKRLRADDRTRLLPIVILTSSGEERDLTEGYASGANSFVSKPVEFAEFSQAIQRLGMYWLLVNKAAPLPTAT